jgi:eukaryotic-like serine/threonine-protein kinase
MSEKWDQVKELFTLALEHNPEERSRFLRQACAGDDSLLREVESLLSNFEGTDTFLEESPAANLFFARSCAIVDRRIGAYRVLRQIGQGGMAIVYLAERADDQYRKNVAIKMLKPGTHSDEFLRRFRNERQALAALDHPSIVKLLDGGSTEDGLPYLIMEYVEGIRIDQYCDANRLSITERVRLFREVCLAVQYAHDALVIHRDLKPSNILITQPGVVRLLDFGIAKVLNPILSPDVTLTGTDWHPMTPQYASPEQLCGAPVSKATDIYSLGLLLYELLSGRRPFPRSDSVLGTERARNQQEPSRPSVAASKSGDKTFLDDRTRTVVSPRSIAEARATQPAELRRRLRGDLDTIVMKAIRAEPEQRYESSGEFANDIERYLNGLPIKACKPTPLYRCRKFAYRHTESLLTAILMVAVAGSLVLWTIHKSRIEKNAEIAASARHVHIRPSAAILGFKNLSARADTAWISTALSEMLTAELAAGEQLRTVPDETVEQTRIDLGLSDAESLPRDSLPQLRRNLGSDFIILGSYLDLGKEKGSELRVNLRVEDLVNGETVAAASESGTEKAINDLGLQLGARLRQQLSLAKLSQLEFEGVRAELPSKPEAMRAYYQGLGKIRAFDPLSARELLSQCIAADPQFPLAHSELARTWSLLGYDANAQQEGKKALDRAGNLSREKHLLVEARFQETSRNWGKAIEAYQTLFNFFPDNLEYGLQLAGAETAAGRGKEALKSLAALDTLGSQTKDNPRISLARSEAAASIGDNQLRRDAAELAAQQAEAEGAKLLVARARDVECRALADLGENDKVTRACEEARQIYEAAGDRIGLAQTLHDMAEVPINQGDFVTAERFYTQALAIARAVGNQKGQAKELLNLGVISVKKGDFTTARRFYGRSFRHYQTAGDKYGLAGVMGNTGIMLRAQGRLQDAMKDFQMTFDLSNEVGHRGSAAQALAAIGDVLMEEGDLGGADKMYTQALAIEREIGRKTIYASTLTQLGRVRRQQAKTDEAQQAYRESLSLEDSLGNRSDAAETRLALAELDCDSGDPVKAEQLSRAAVEAFRSDAYTNEEIFAQSVLSRALLQQGKTAEASATIAEALKLSQRSQDVMVRIPVTINHAYVMAAEKDFESARITAQGALNLARKLGLTRMQLEASLALGEIEIKGPNPNAGRRELAQTEKNARSQGFELVAYKVGQALSH